MDRTIGRTLPTLPRVLTLLPLAACTGGDPTTTLAPRAAPSLAAASATVRVQPGTSIQAALNEAGANGTVLIEPGVYAESLVVVTPGLHVRGLGDANAGVVIVNPGGANNGIRVASTGAGFDLDNVTVRGFARNGVFLIGVDGFRLSRVRTDHDGAYGLFPIRSSHGVIEDCSATGHDDTGIYIGQSSDIVIRKSVAWGNVAGFELENSTRVAIEHSDAYDNTVGVLVSLVPGLRVMTATDNVVAHNRILHNNLPNFGDPDDFAGLLPAGVGVLVIGVDRVTVEHNTITNNVSAGVVTVSAQLLLLLSGLPPDAYGTVDPNADGGIVRHNVLTSNGTAPQPPLSLFFPGADLLWDGSGVGNCWEKNTFVTSVPSPLPACK